MQQVLFRIPGLNLPIYGYGLLLVMGFFLAIQLGRFLARRSGIDPDFWTNVGLIALVTGVLGARISHIVENLGDYTNPNRTVLENLRDAVNISSGGLTYYGGFLLAFPSLVWYARKKGVSIRLGMDIIAPCLMIGLGFGRIGCLLNGCCYGARCELPWAITFPFHSIPHVDQYRNGELSVPPELRVETESGRERLITSAELAESPTRRELARSNRSLPVHPAQIYSALTAFLIAALTLAYFTLPRAPGRGFALMLMFEGVSRYILEMLRVEPAVLHLGGHGISLSMVIGFGVALLGAALWLVFGRLQTKHPVSTSIAPAAS